MPEFNKATPPMAKAGPQVDAALDRSARASGPIEPGPQIAPNPVTGKKKFVKRVLILIIRNFFCFIHNAIVVQNRASSI